MNAKRMFYNLKMFTAPGLVIGLAMTSPVLAQDAAFDPFGQNEDESAEEMLQQQQGAEGALHINEAAQALFDGASAYPTPPTSWVNFDQAAQGMDSLKAESIYQGSAEFRVRKELEQPLPTRKPFGDRLGDLERELNPPDVSGRVKK